MTDAKLQVTKYAYDLEGNMTSLTSPMGRVEQFIYDPAGRLSERITPSGNAIYYDYNTLNSLAEKSYHNTGELNSDHPVQMGYNAMGQRISMEDITGDSHYIYDSLGRLKIAENGSGKKVSYEYDEADNLSAIVYPDEKRVEYEYDKNDNITKLTDRDGRETAFAYDPLNRLTKVVRADGSESSYTYNARNQVLQVTNICSCGFLISDYQYTYDDAGLIIREEAKECLYTSDKDYGHKGGDRDACAHVEDNPWKNQNPVWETTIRTFTYDDNGQMTRCEESKGQFDKVTYTYEYDEAGNRTLARKAKLYDSLNSWKMTYTYNADNQMVAAKVCEGHVTKNYTFTYDANGNLTAECFKNKAEVTYQYDTENRLTAVYDQYKLLVASVYDGDGNRTFQLNYNPDAECGYGMNVSGEIFMPEHSQNEDESLTAEGQLFSYISSKTGRTYELTEYVNDTNREYTEVLAAYNVNTGVDKESYSYAGSMRISKNTFWNEALNLDHDQMSYYLYDGRGSVTVTTWCNGMVTKVYQYDPYGQVTYGSTEHEDFYGYNGESYNPNSGLVYLRARYYNANQGRFFQEDTYLGDITDPLTLNRYAYVKNSPLNYVDPSGHSAAYPTVKKTSIAKLHVTRTQEVQSSRRTKVTIQQQYPLDELMNWVEELKERYTDSCSAFQKGLQAGKYIALANMQNLAIGNALNYFGVEWFYNSDEDLSAYYDQISSEFEPTEENIQDFLLGYQLGGSIIIAEMAEILTEAGASTAGMFDSQPGGAALVEIVGADGSVYHQEIPGTVTIIDEELLLIPGARIEFDEGKRNSEELKEVYNSIKDSPNYPEGFQPRKNGTTRNAVKNKGLLEKLRTIESGTWKKIYRDGYDAYGNEISIHYFQSESGRVFDVKVKPYWSN